MAEKKTEKKSEMKIEETFDKLEEVIGIMEKPETGLEETFELYKQGLDMIKRCNDSITSIEKQITELEEDD